MLDKQPMTTQIVESIPSDARPASHTPPQGIALSRYFTATGVDPLDTVAWERRDAAITGESGEVYFEQRDVEVPKSWSQLATNVVVQKYFRGALGTEQRETSVRQLIQRVSGTLTRWGHEGGYFQSEADAQLFRQELDYLLVHQFASFNSPVWFNVGVEEHPQCSACFINAVEDTMDSILGLAKTEGMLFKWGSGTGTNFSTLRSSKERLNGGGLASGPVSFMKGFDAFAGVIKSGGKTRRAAKMVILNADHPDIVEYVNCKASEEKKAWALIDAGYDGSFNGEAYSSVFFQNSNNSVRVTDEFMEAVLKDRPWQLRNVTTGEVAETISARELMRQISAAAHLCGDPGLQFDTAVNRWHTCPNSARINASNPCSEYMFVDNSACNLSSLNLRKFQRQDGNVDVEAFRHAVRVMILAQEIIIDRAKYPTDKIADNSRTFRPLGLGYANLGALLMSRGLPYDSDAGRAYAGALSALMHGEANRTSAMIAAVRGPFAEYQRNAAPMLAVLERHERQLDFIDAAYVPYELMEAARLVWKEARALGQEHGLRNAQVTVLAPTGTIGFMMDCDTTGIEPDIALVKYKKLVGGGMLKMINYTVPEALTRLGYDETQSKAILGHIDAHDTIEGAPHLKDEHLAVFDCAFRAAKGSRSIHYKGHVRMMAAVQPFLSGAISKTVNLPTDATVEDIEDAYLEAWRLGLKAIAVYRDGCKRVQPLSVSKSSAAEVKSESSPRSSAVDETVGPPESVRHRLSDERQSLTHKFNVGGHEGYLTVGMYKDGRPGEIFIVMAKEGSTISGLMDSFATAISLALQHGVPLSLLVDKFSHTRFEPSGFSHNAEIGYAKSVMDYLFRWLDLKFPNGRFEAMLPSTSAHAQATHAAAPGRAPIKAAAQTGGSAGNGKRNGHGRTNGKKNGHSNGGGLSTLSIVPHEELGPVVDFLNATESALETFVRESDAPACHECGSIMVRSGACHKCLNCGATSGCS